MRKILFLLIPFYIFAYEIDFSKNFTKDLMPNVLGVDISIIIEDSKEELVIKRLELFNENIKEYNKVEKQLGTFNIRPQYQRSTNNPKIYGYRGELSYKVETANALHMGEFISMITSLKEDRDTSISLNNLSWRVKDDSYNTILDLLRLESINWGENYAKELSGDLKKECKVKSINLSNNTMHTFRESMATLKYEPTLQKENVPIPEILKQKILIIANYKLECK